MWTTVAGAEDSHSPIPMASSGKFSRNGEMHKHRVCPWWLGYLLLSPIRRLRQDPSRIVAPYLREGMTVLEPGPAMGFFTLELARRVGAAGRVIAVDVQPRMIERLKRRAAKANLAEIIDARVSPPDSMQLNGFDGRVDFVLAFAVVHEMPDPSAFFAEAAAAMKPGARMLLAEPFTWVSEADFGA
jgi:2-polyprenyl-3-methyl-5-hydroxy-6-metoxy-1,4-benzoquinol methylase